jgi:hypothetical protein
MEMDRFSAEFGSAAGGLIAKHAKHRVFQLYTADKGGTDDLHVAVKYLAQSIRSIKTGQQYHLDSNRAIEEALGQLADRLVEVVNDCKPS